MTRRFLEKFTSLDEAISYTWPGNRYEYDSTQALRSPYTPVVGANYAYRLRGTALALKGVAKERVRFVLIGTSDEQDYKVGDLRSKLYLAGFGKLWLRDENNDRRWAYGELESMPEISLSYSQPSIRPVILSFNRLSDWYDEDGISASATKTASPATLVVVNHGNLPTDRVVIRIRSNSAAGFANVKVVNDTNGYEFRTLRDAASTAYEVKLDTSRPSVEYSIDDGLSYINDFDNYVKPPLGQRLLSFVLEPGSNTLTITSDGTPNYDIVVTGYAAAE